MNSKDTAKKKKKKIDLSNENQPGKCAEFLCCVLHHYHRRQNVIQIHPSLSSPAIWQSPHITEPEAPKNTVVRSVRQKGPFFLGGGGGGRLEKF